MSSIQPIATTRVTDAITRGRLTAQIQQDQRDLFRLQNQLSTGYRIFLPSDDPSAAQRAIVLQRTLERKDQSVTNLQGARDALEASEASLGDVSNRLNELKSAALGVVDSFASDDERQSVVDTIDTLLRSLVQVGNASFTGSFLFGGSEIASEPFAGSGQFVEYVGDESSPQTFVDIGLLFEQALPGDEVFGGISEAVRGTADLDPQPTPDTRLAQLNGGNGVSPNGSIEITFRPSSGSNPTTTAVIDLGVANTLGDVTRLIESNAPDGAQLTATVNGEGLLISAANGDLLINEVGDGVTANELGILQPDTLSSTVSGQPLNPTLRVTTPLSDLSGTKARGLLELTGVNNDLSLVATENGVDFNGLNVVFTDTATLGSETASFDGTTADGGTNTLTIAIADGESNAQQIAAAINDAASGVPFVAETDYRDATEAATQGIGAVSVPSGTITGVTAGGSGDSIDLASGLRITNGPQEIVVDTSTAETLEDLLNLLNDPSFGLNATINAAGDGINVRTRRSGADFTIGENGGDTATDLGIRTFTADSRLADFNRGQGVVLEGPLDDEGEEDIDISAQNRFTLEVTEDGVTTTYDIDATGATTVEDLIQQISDDTGGAVEASLAAVGNGLTLIATDPDSPAAEASGSFNLGTDTLTITADTTGDDGNRPFTVEVLANNGGAPLSTSVVGDAITVDLGGAPATTDQIALAISGALTGFTVTSNGPIDTISADITPPVAAATTGGQAASVDAVAATGDFTLNGDTITFDADTAGPNGNQTFTVVLDDQGTDGLETTIDGTTITVNLGGSDSTSDAIAASISAELSGYTVSSDGNAAVVQADIGAIGPFAAALTGGRAADSITASGALAERLGLVDEATPAADGSLTSSDRNPFEVDSVFTTLLRMREALLEGDDAAFEAEINRLDDDLDRVSFGRSEIGVRIRNLDSIENRIADEEVTLRAALSREIDADLIEVISDYSAQQASLQASLQTSATLLQLSILDFI